MSCRGIPLTGDAGCPGCAFGSGCCLPPAQALALTNSPEEDPDSKRSLPRKARRVLQAAAVEAHERPGVYVLVDKEMQRANGSDADEFRAIGRYLQAQGWIAEADDDYGIFVLTVEGVDEAMD